MSVLPPPPPPLKPITEFSSITCCVEGVLFIFLRPVSKPEVVSLVAGVAPTMLGNKTLTLPSFALSVLPLRVRVAPSALPPLSPPLAFPAACLLSCLSCRIVSCRCSCLRLVSSCFCSGSVLALSPLGRGWLYAAHVAGVPGIFTTTPILPIFHHGSYRVSFRTFFFFLFFSHDLCTLTNGGDVRPSSFGFLPDGVFSCLGVFRFVSSFLG